jgi:hypothetical protein
VLEKYKECLVKIDSYPQALKAMQWNVRSPKLKKLNDRLEGSKTMLLI